MITLISIQLPDLLKGYRWHMWEIRNIVRGLYPMSIERRYVHARQFIRNQILLRGLPM